MINVRQVDLQRVIEFISLANIKNNTSQDLEVMIFWVDEEINLALGQSVYKIGAETSLPILSNQDYEMQMVVKYGGDVWEYSSEVLLKRNRTYKMVTRNIENGTERVLYCSIKKDSNGISTVSFSPSFTLVNLTGKDT